MYTIKILKLRNSSTLKLHLDISHLRPVLLNLDQNIGRDALLLYSVFAQCQLCQHDVTLLLLSAVCKIVRIISPIKLSL